MEQRISVITLGVADLELSRNFYEKGLGWKVSGRMVHTSHAFTVGTSEGSCAHFADTSRTAAQLVPRQRHDLSGCRRGPKQQSKTDYEKVVRFSDVRSHTNRSISQSREAARARIHPQIVVRRQ